MRKRVLFKQALRNVGHFIFPWDIILLEERFELKTELNRHFPQLMFDGYVSDNTKVQELFFIYDLNKIYQQHKYVDYFAMEILLSIRNHQNIGKHL